eukprot:1995865-Alexandrium_andersonii.AAC.1
MGFNAQKQLFNGFSRTKSADLEAEGGDHGAEAVDGVRGLDPCQILPAQARQPPRMLCVALGARRRGARPA